MLADEDKKFHNLSQSQNKSKAKDVDDEGSLSWSDINTTPGKAPSTHHWDEPDNLLPEF